MRIIKSFFIAVSTYSKIPVPQFEWKEEDMKYVFCFFPWIGAWIGGCVYLWNDLCGILGVGDFCRLAGSLVIPILVTGGIHVDGFMDTMDAMHSYRPRERKLEILKDSHIGAFAVITLAAYGFIFLGAFSEIPSGPLLKVACGGFFLSRCLCGIAAVSFPLAKKDGMLFCFADRSRRRAVKAALYLQSAACAGLMLYWSRLAGAFVTAAALFALVFYYYRGKKEFGGMTGDTAGYFILLCEGSVAVAAAIANIMTGG